MMRNNHRVLLLAHGQGTRWDETAYPEYPVKHLAHIAGEPIIGRTIRQCRALGIEDIVIIGPVQTFEHLGVPVAGLRETLPGPCYGMAETAHLWTGQGRVWIVQGDVVCSWGLLEHALADKALIRMYGRIHPHHLTDKFHSERSLVSFIPEPEIITRLMRCVRASIAQHTFPAGFRALMEAMQAEFGEDVLSTLVGDYTDDIDSVSEYEDHGPIFEAAIWEEYRVRGYL